MTLLRAVLVALGLAILLAGSHIWGKYAISRPITVTIHPQADTTSVLDEAATGAAQRDEGRGDWAEARVDVNGNEIDEAVGDYRVDSRGEMYEHHAPDTALPHLGAAGL